MEFRFIAHGCPDGDWKPQLVRALQTHTETLSRRAVPGIWKMTDRLNRVSKAPEYVLRRRRIREIVWGILLLLLGLFLIIPGLVKPKELFFPLLVGLFAAVTGLTRLLPRRKRENRRLLRSAETLLHNRAAVTEAVVIFDENGLCPDGAEPVAYDSLVTAVEADDLYFFTWGNQALLLFKQELQNQSPEAFSGWLAERITLLRAHDAP